MSLVRKQIATWWQISRSWGTTIEPCQVVAFTGKTVTYLQSGWGSTRETRANIESEGYSLRPTFAEAKALKLQLLASRIESLERQIAQLRSDMAKVEKMQEPQP